MMGPSCTTGTSMDQTFIKVIMDGNHLLLRVLKNVGACEARESLTLLLLISMCETHQQRSAHMFTLAAWLPRALSITPTWAFFRNQTEHLDWRVFSESSSNIMDVSFEAKIEAIFVYTFRSY